MKVRKLDLSKEVSSSIYNLLIGIGNNPYQNYPGFRDEITNLINKGVIPQEFLDLSQEIKSDRKSGATYAHLLKNCPIDEVRPIFDHANPVEDKYVKKTTFVGESFLELVSQLWDMPPLAYDTRNNGDFFHDVYAQSKYSGTQTQKTDSDLFYHNDRTAHHVRADYLALLGMRTHDENRVYTGYIDGRAILQYLTAEQQIVLRQPYFCTPFDEYSKDSNKKQDVSDAHYILEDIHTFRYYETRTTVLDDAPVLAKDALLALKNAILLAEKDHVHINTGELFVFPNQQGLHNRLILEVRDPEEAKKRWLLKTYNFKDTQSMEKYLGQFHADIPGLVKETVTV